MTVYLSDKNPYKVLTEHIYRDSEGKIHLTDDNFHIVLQRLAGSRAALDEVRRLIATQVVVLDAPEVNPDGSFMLELTVSW